MGYAGRTFYRPIATNLRTTIGPLSLIAVAAVESSQHETRWQGNLSLEFGTLFSGNCVPKTVFPRTGRMLLKGKCLVASSDRGAMSKAAVSSGCMRQAAAVGVKPEKGTTRALGRGRMDRMEHHANSSISKSFSEKR